MSVMESPGRVARNAWERKRERKQQKSLHGRTHRNLMGCLKLAVNCNERCGIIRKGCTERIGTHWSTCECQTALMGTSSFNSRGSVAIASPMGRRTLPPSLPWTPADSKMKCLFGTHENVTRTHENLLKWAFRALRGRLGAGASSTQWLHSRLGAVPDRGSRDSHPPH